VGCSYSCCGGIIPKSQKYSVIGAELRLEEALNNKVSDTFETAEYVNRATM
jgi:hypothetical protein